MGDDQLKKSTEDYFGINDQSDGFNNAGIDTTGESGPWQATFEVPNESISIKDIEKKKEQNREVEREPSHMPRGLGKIMGGIVGIVVIVLTFPTILDWVSSISIEGEGEATQMALDILSVFFPLMMVLMLIGMILRVFGGNMD